MGRHQQQSRARANTGSASRSVIRRVAAIKRLTEVSGEPHVTGLHLNPLRHASCSAGMKKTPIQALDRLAARVLLLSPGRARPRFEYLREGTLSLYAAVRTRRPESARDNEPGHTSAESHRSRHLRRK